MAHVPLLGRSVAVMRGVATAADDVAREVLPPLLDTADGLKPTALRRADGTIDVTLIKRSTPTVSSAAARADEVDKRFAALPTGLLPGPVASVRRDFADQLGDLSRSLRNADDALTVAPSLLGADRPRRWFLLVQQTSESRGTGGLPGGFAVLEARNGRLSVSSTGSNADLKNGEVRPQGLPADYVERYDPDGAFDLWQNINLSPDLPVVSRYVVQRWKAQTGQVLDGVIALDAVALSDLLRGSGAVQVSATRSVQPEAVADYLALGQYRNNPGPLGQQSARKEELTVVSRAVIARLTSGGGDSESLVKGLITAVRSGHVRIASDDAQLAPVLRRSRADGGLPRDGRPFVYPVVINAAGSKLEYFLDRSVRWSGGSCDGKRQRTTVRLVLRTNPPPLKQLPPYVTIRLQDGKETQTLVDRLGVSFYATAGSRLVAARLNGQPLPLQPSSPDYVSSDTEAGLPVWQTYLDVPPANDRVLELDLDQPVVPGLPEVLEQPLARPQASMVTVPRCS